MRLLGLLFVIVLLLLGVGLYQGWLSVDDGTLEEVDAAHSENTIAVGSETLRLPVALRIEHLRRGDRIRVTLSKADEESRVTTVDVRY